MDRGPLDQLDTKPDLTPATLRMRPADVCHTPPLFMQHEQHGRRGLHQVLPRSGRCGDESGDQGPQLVRTGERGGGERICLSTQAVGDAAVGQVGLQAGSFRAPRWLRALPHLSRKRGQATVITLADPLGRGWNLLDLHDAHVSYVPSQHPSVMASTKVLSVLAGHILGVTTAHCTACAGTTSSTGNSH